MAQQIQGSPQDSDDRSAPQPQPTVDGFGDNTGLEHQSYIQQPQLSSPRPYLGTGQHRTHHVHRSQTSDLEPDRCIGQHQHVDSPDDYHGDGYDTLPRRPDGYQCFSSMQNGSSFGLHPRRKMPYHDSDVEDLFAVAHRDLGLNRNQVGTFERWDQATPAHLKISTED
jgi:hypothetical protein